MCVFVLLVDLKKYFWCLRLLPDTRRANVGEGLRLCEQAGSSVQDGGRTEKCQILFRLMLLKEKKTDF